MTHIRLMSPQTRFVVVTGKGGVGRTTVACSLALAAARSGRRTCIVELYGQSSVARRFGLSQRTYLPRTVAPGVDTMSLTPMEAIDDFGHRKVKLDTLLRVVLKSRVVSAFLDAVPGLHDLVQLGKIEHLLSEPMPGDPRYDLIIIDAPATGHGLTLLSAARTMQDMAKVGPFHELASIIQRALGNTELTATVLVTLPEELPVQETLELAQSLGEQRASIRAVIANQVRPRPLPERPSWDALRATLDANSDPDLHLLARLAEKRLDAHQAQEAALEKLHAGVARTIGRAVSVFGLPRVESEDWETLTDACLHKLADP